MHQKADRLEGSSGCPGERWPEPGWSSSSGRSSKKWLELGPGLEMELTELTYALATKDEKKKLKMIPRILS